MHSPNLLRRRLTLAMINVPVLAALGGCAPPLRPLRHPSSAADARAVLEESALAHGARSLATIGDLSVSYAGHWRALVGRLQPELVDAGYRGSSEERLLFAERSVAQAFEGPSGHKQVARHAGLRGPGDVRVWFDDEEAHDGPRRAAAALVVDGYSLFLLGPMVIARYWSVERELSMELDGVERLVSEHRRYDCDVLRIRMAPGLGFSAMDELALFIDARDRLLRRVRFTLNGLESTQGAIAEVEMYDHLALEGVQWPTRYYERLLRPLPLPVHNWTLTGLDVNRGLTAADLDGARFSSRAARPATPLR